MARHYLTTHEWVEVSGDTARIGISNHAQEVLGDIVFISLPKEGSEVSQGVEYAIIESMKAASPVHAPVSGTVKSVNTTLTGSPEKINIAPLHDGWIAEIAPFKESDLSSLMDEETYLKFLKNQ